MALLSGREGSSAKQMASIGCGYVRFRSLQPRAHGWIRAGRSREQVLPALARSAHHLVANACAQQPIRAAVRDTARAPVTLRRAGVSTHAYGAAALADGDCAYDTVVHASTADRWHALVWHASAWRGAWWLRRMGWQPQHTAAPRKADGGGERCRVAHERAKDKSEGAHTQW